MSDVGGDEGIATAKLLLAERSPERLVAALVRLQRGRIPAPEELQEVPLTSRAPRSKPVYGRPAYKSTYKGKKPRA